MAIRFLHLADTHLGARHSSRCGGDPFVAATHRALAPARRGETDLVLHGGDLFHRSRPPPRILAAAAGELVAAAEGGAEVVVVPGNHERSLLPARLLLGHPRIHIIEEPTCLRLDLGGLTISIHSFPFVRERARDRFERLLRDAGWPRGRAEVGILLCHQTFRGATVGPADYVFRWGPDVIPPAWIPEGMDYAALGHIHRHQFLAHPGRPDLAVAYPSSTERTSRAERFEVKGTLKGEIHGPRDVRVRFRKLPSVPLPSNLPRAEAPTGA